MLLDLIAAQFNASIAASRRAAEQAASVEGASLAICVEGLGLHVLARVARQRLALTLDAADAATEADVKISGTPLDLLRLLGGDSLRELKGSRIELSGDMRLAEGFADLLKAARPDLEEALSGFTGDIAAHAIGQSLRELARWSQRARQAVELDTAEYLQEEATLLPQARQVRAFLGDVDRLRDDVERAAARVARLSNALATRD
jgi:ubiquinone biosynthesis protein UbiJ